MEHDLTAPDEKADIGAAQPTSAPPAAPESAPPAHPVRRAAQGALRLYQNVDKVDRWGGGGFGLSTLVKLAGWSGLVAVLAVLFVRLRTIQSELDPVAHGVEKLQGEVDGARRELRASTGRSRLELEQLSHDASSLRQTVAHAAQVDQHADRAVQDADARAQALVSALEDETAHTRELEARVTQLQAVLSGLTAAGGTLQGGLDRASSTLAGASDSLQRAQAHAGQLDRDLGSLSPAAARAAVARAEQDAQTLAAALERMTARVNSLDQALQKRAEALQRPAERVRETPRQSAPRPRADREEAQEATALPSAPEQEVSPHGG